MIIYHNLYSIYIKTVVFWLIRSTCLIRKTSIFTTRSTSTATLVCQLRVLQLLKDIQYVFCDRQGEDEIV